MKEKELEVIIAQLIIAKMHEKRGALGEPKACTWLCTSGRLFGSWATLTDGDLGRPTRCPQVVSRLTRHSRTRHCDIQGRFHPLSGTVSAGERLALRRGEFGVPTTLLPAPMACCCCWCWAAAAAARAATLVLARCCCIWTLVCCWAALGATVTVVAFVRVEFSEELPVVETAPPATGSSVFNRMRRPISGVCETSNVNSIVRPASSFLQNISESGYAP